MAATAVMPMQSIPGLHDPLTVEDMNKSNAAYVWESLSLFSLGVHANSGSSNEDTMGYLVSPPICT